MSLSLKLDSIIFILFIIVLIIVLVKREKISIKYSLVWLFPCVLMLIFVLIPGFLSFITNLLGFQTASNMIFALLIGFLIVVTIALTVIVSKQKEKIRLLIQEISLLKEKK